MNLSEQEKSIYEKLTKLRGVNQLLALNTVNTLYEVQLNEEKKLKEKKII